MTKLKQISNVILSAAVAAIPVALAIFPEVPNSIVFAAFIGLAPISGALLADAFDGERK